MIADQMPAAAGDAFDLVAFDVAAELAALADLWPSALIGAESLAAAERHAVGLPPIFHWTVLEARLTGDSQHVDLLASIADLPGARARVAEAIDGELPAALVGARPLLDRWSHRRDPALAGVHVIWLEWDAPFTRAYPLQLLSIDPRFWGDEAAPDPTLDEQVELAAAGRRAIFGEPPAGPRLAALRRAIAALPPDACALAAADFRGRGQEVDRLFVGVPRDLVLPWLADIGWPGDRKLVATWLRRAIAPWEQAFLQIELDPAVRPYLGIEPQQTGGTRSELRERRRFLEGLVSDGLTSLDKIRAVLDWPGERTRPGTDLVTVRSVHLKCVLQPEEAPLVKAYLGFHLRRS
ncbi:hypothetical protein [Nannocystis sp. SCPEA4]|uniref:hypothetical protein n=1 Tax=Nannocystis sp. SCPEA4 TaxID=2996787 RepID=UPI00226E5A55|nr:hypothetical protein [Nannocystis sp. SCPEA4]MCY1061752.1 hypothetical protein [Nannocystis sp. SCPEA4]